MSYAPSTARSPRPRLAGGRRPWRLAGLAGLGLLTAWLANRAPAAEPAAAAANPATPNPGGTTMTFGTLATGRILFLGNSITLHGPSAAVSWTGNWGMAASSADRDYVHLVLAGIEKGTGKRPESRVDNIADFERQYATLDLAARLRDHLAFKPDIVVLAIGENVAALKTPDEQAAFEAALRKLVALLKSAGQPALFVRSCFWPDDAKDPILKRVCADAGGTFVDIAALGRDPANAARSERTFAHDGVAGHPGDRGMQAIADALLAAMRAHP